SRYSYYLHFDSWRLNLQPGVWLPTYIYIEESGTKRSSPPFHNLYFKAQTRLWGYDVERLKHDQEFTQIQVETAQDRSESARDTGPVEAQRMWERVAEDNALDHLQKVGLLAPQGEVDRILQTVVNNLIITNKLEIVPDVRCRVLLTTPLESFTTSPYQCKLSNAGLFLKALQKRAPELTSLIKPHLGNTLGNAKTTRLSTLASSAPPLEMQRIEQIAALPLGGRIKLN